MAMLFEMLTVVPVVGFKACTDDCYAYSEVTVCSSGYYIYAGY
jgi:hypothetical protein